MNPEHQRIVAGRALTLHERLEDLDAVTCGDKTEEWEVTDRLEEWRDRFPSQTAFDQRLARDGFDEDDARAAIRADRLAPTEPVPEWIERLEDVIEFVHGANPEFHRSEQTLDVADVDNWIFPELTEALINYARASLTGNAVEAVLSETTLDDLSVWLRERLQRSFGRMLFVEFKTFVGVHDRELATAEPEAFDEPPTEYYEQFVEYLFSGGFEDLCQQYPMFARLVVTQIRQWREHIEEFCERLVDDRANLEATFGTEQSLGEVVTLDPLADDTHGDGRAVMRVDFESGRSLVYKPRPADAGETFYDALEALDEHTPTPDFRYPDYVCRDTHAWMEWVEFEECPDEAAVERYYQRAGALICLAYFLEFPDCQIENLVVAGEYPLLVDFETILHDYRRIGQMPNQIGLGAIRSESVLISSLLPIESDSVGAQQQGDLGSKMAGISLSSEESELEGMTIPDIRAPNTDVMTVENIPAPVDRENSVPRVDGTDCSPEDYVDEITDGFRRTYQTILDLRENGTLSDIGVPDAFESYENRSVFRPTFKYGKVLRNLGMTDALSDGIGFGIEVEELATPFFDGQVEADRTWPFFERERAALKRLDPPRFVSTPESKKIRFEGEAIGAPADESGIVRSRRRISAASREDMLEQLEYIRAAYGQRPDPNPVWEMDLDDVSTEPRDDVALRDEAVTLFERVQDAATPDYSGSYYWASLAQHDATDRLTLHSSDSSMYHGRSGIAIFGAALYHLTNDERYREFVERTLQPIRRMLTSELFETPSADSDAELQEAYSTGQIEAGLHRHGGVAGIGATTYGLTVVGELLDEPEFLDDAHRAAAFVTDSTIEHDDTYDVNGGVAGTILSLLALHDRDPDDELISACRACGDHLLEAQMETDSGHRTWETLDAQRPVTGFAHGPSGISYALFRLFEETGDDRYREAALDGLRYENETYDESEHNWRDTREWSATDFYDQWCYGRSGIGLARIGMDQYVSAEPISRDIERAVRGVSDADSIHRYDHACCGNAGCAEFLIEATRHTDLPTPSVNELLGKMLSRRDAAGKFTVATETDRINKPTFYNGVAGIGYTLLRATAPEELPCVLRWE